MKLTTILTRTASSRTLESVNAFLFCFVFLLPQAFAKKDGELKLGTRPNFVFIYADDWRWDCMGVVQREQGEAARFPWLETPNLDELAEKSLRFREAFVVNSLCSPGRACVLTGQYSHANGIIDNKHPMRTDSPTLATRLRDAGYNTAYCGKFHMGSQRERSGFEYVASFIGQGRYFDCPILLNGKETPTKGWIDDVSTDHAVEFLSKQSPDKPFFLFLGFKSPHGPRGGAHIPERFRNLYANERSRNVPNIGLEPIFRAGESEIRPNAGRWPEVAAEGHRAYMQHITAIDECVGRVLDELQRTGQAENTVVIVTSDNGYYLGEHGLSDKRSAYEESLRVPLLIHVPSEKVASGVRDGIVLNIDHAETILDLAGAEPLPKPAAHARAERSNSRTRGVLLRIFQGTTVRFSYSAGRTNDYA
jgi:arylsulfatase A-like enzyme